MTLEKLKERNKPFFALLFDADDCNVIEDPADGEVVLHIATMHSTNPIYSIAADGALAYKRRCITDWAVTC